MLALGPSEPSKALPCAPAARPWGPAPNWQQDAPPNLPQVGSDPQRRQRQPGTRFWWGATEEGSVPQGQAPTGGLRELNTLQPAWKNKQQREPEPRACESGSNAEHGSCSESCWCTHTQTHTHTHPKMGDPGQRAPQSTPHPHGPMWGQLAPRLHACRGTLMAHGAAGIHSPRERVLVFFTSWPKHTGENEINSRRISRY